VGVADIAVVTDSSCYLPAALIDSLDITVVSLYYDLGAGPLRESEFDGDLGRFYAELDASNIVATTSAAPVADFTVVFERLLAQHSAVVSVLISSGISETCSNARQAAAQLESEERVVVIDSAGTGGNLGVQALAAARAANSGEDRSGVIARIRRARQGVRRALEDSDRVSAQAIEMAERVSDTKMLLLAMHSRQWATLGLDRIDEAIASGEEMVRLARIVGDRDMEFEGDFRAVDEEIAACDRLAGELHQPRYLWQVAVFRTMRALMKGRYKESERLAQTALSIGQLDKARAVFATLEADGFEALRHSSYWLNSVCQLSVAAIAIGDRDAASALYELLAPYADRCMLYLAGAGCLGSNHAFVGFAAAAAARHQDAVRHFELALARNAEIGCDYMTPRVCYEYARTLFSRAEPADREKAMGLIDDGLELARGVGMRGEAERLTQLRQEHQEQRAMLGWSALESVAQSVELVRPDLRAVAAPDGTVTIMFSDIEGSTVLTEQLGDERWLMLLHRHNAVIRRHLAAHRGFEVKSQGDGFMVAFDSARSAMRCAIAIQRDFAAYRDQSGNQVLRVRIGLHTGEVIREQEDFFGHAVVLAARIGAKANGNEILVSAVLRGLVAGSHEFEFGETREEQLKGLRDPQRVYEVCWQ
jgi:class 3 adenylate cyclase